MAYGHKLEGASGPFQGGQYTTVHITVLLQPEMPPLLAGQPGGGPQPHLQSILYCTVEYCTMYCSVLTTLEGARGPFQGVIARNYMENSHF